MTEFNIRKIQKDDNLAIKSIIIESLKEFGANREGFASEDPDIDDLFSTYQKEHSIYLVVVGPDREIYGGGGLAPLVGDNSILELQKFYLLLESRGKGFGKLLLSQLIERAKEMNFQEVYLETLSSMNSAIALYSKFGFKKLKAPLGDTGHFGCDNWMLLSLNIDISS